VLSGSQKKTKSGSSPKKLVVLLHGYGANGENLIDLAQMWGESLPDVEFHAPNAVERCESVPLGYQWFGIQDFSPFNMRQGLDKAAPFLKDYLEDLLRTRHLKSSDLALVGFSQGTMMALEMMYCLPDLAAIIGYSGVFYPPISKSSLLPKTEIMLVHGTADMVVPYPLMAQSSQQLQQLGLSVKTHTCPGLGHSINLEGISLGGQFLNQVFSQPDPTIYTI
jgi:phospholipase/carboxylesterase